MGSKPEVGHLLHEFIPADDVYFVEATKRVLDKHRAFILALTFRVKARQYNQWLSLAFRLAELSAEIR